MLAVLLVVLSGPASAQPGGTIPADVSELIVLLEPKSRVPSAPDPVHVVESVNNPNMPVPNGLSEGNPNRAELGIHRRPTAARTLKWIEDNYDMPFARQYRYVVFRYNDNVNLTAIMNALQNNPVVASVEPNLHMTLSSTIPNDPRFGTPGSDPLLFQWGFYVMNFPEAWSLARGHSYIGVIDTGIETQHDEFRAFHGSPGAWIYDGGPFREHLSLDFDDVGRSIELLAAQGSQILNLSGVPERQ